MRSFKSWQPPGYIVDAYKMADLIDVTPPSRYSFAERSAARLRLNRSRFFLVLGLGVQFETERNLLPPTLCTCPAPDAVLKVVTLARTDGKKDENKIRFSNTDARVLIELMGTGSTRLRVAAGRRIVSAIGALFTYVHHTVYGDLKPYQIPRELIRGTEINVEELEELDARTGIDAYPSIESHLTSCVIIAGRLTATIFYLLPFVLQDESLFDACNLFRSCCSEFSFMDGVVREVLDEPRQGPQDEAERLALEHLVLQSFRVVESLVGEPGRDRARFHQRLSKRGLDLDERVGFRGRRMERLEDRIVWLQKARDSAPAHGYRRRRDPFTLFEAMEAQHIAHLVLDRSIWQVAQNNGRLGDVAEVAFLLEEMYPGSPGRARDKRLFRSRRAVDLARVPHGLAKVLRFQNRRGQALYRRTRLPAKQS